MEEKIKDIKQQIINHRESYPFICELKVTELCNMKCKYCYRDEDESVEISFQRTIDFFDELAEYYEGQMVCSFHGGEPLIRIDIIKKILEVLSGKKYYNRMSFTIQTNGTLINEEIIEIFKKYKVGIGISLDYIGDCEDVNRIMIDGRYTSNLVRKKLKI